MPTFTIPSTTLPVGQTTVGPLTGLSAGFSCAITVDRTGSGSHPWLDTLTSSSVLDVLIQSSPDGVTWDNEVESSTIGGTLISAKNGTTETTWELEVDGLNPGATEVRAVVTVTGPSSIEVSGSLVVT